MKTRSFFVGELEKGAASVLITGDELKHLRGVLRLREGEAVTIFNGRGLVVKGVIQRIVKQAATVSVLGEDTESRESSVHVVLLQALVKGDKNDFIVQKAVELGATGIVFYAAKRTVPLLGPGRGTDRLIRWRRIAIEAAKQCGRSVIPGISLADGIEEAVAGHACPRMFKAGKGFLKIMLLESETTRTIKDMLRTAPAAKAAALLIGPEGGFTDEDVVHAAKNGFTPVSLGRRILRAETAAIAALTIVQYELDGMD
ncbi:MAG: 16S rRNA (uracil(1498)-N(3))-methyltransferase [Deltaproteobacteria bacterium]|jgi:16S rRNA (uracil1498-N3)-methyltransferase